MSDKIVEFPTHRLPSKKLQSELKELQDSLRDCYQKVDEAMDAVMNMESHIEAIENSYNQKLFELAEAIGASNLAIEDLEFATNIAVSIDENGRVSMEMVDPLEEYTIEFTPDQNLFFDPEGEDQ